MQTKRLIELIETNNLESLSRLLSPGLDINAPLKDYHDCNALQIAVGHLTDGGAIETVDLLLNHGASPDSALFVAVSEGHEECVRLLLARGADPNRVDEEGDTPLRFCVTYGNALIAQILLSSGATKTIDTYGGFSGMTALGIAVSQLDVSIIELLLQHGANPNAPDETAQGPINRLPERTIKNAVAWDKVKALFQSRP